MSDDRGLSGGAQPGSGARPLPPELRRDVPFKCHLRPGQAADLVAIAEGWGVPPGTALYAVMAAFLSEVRTMPMPHARDTLLVRASCRMLARMGEDAPLE